MTDPIGQDTVLGRVADPDATETLTLPGGCRCPGAPHADGDAAIYRTQLGAGERNAIKAAGWQAADMEYYDWEAANDAAIAKAVTSWTILTAEPCWHAGKPHGKNEPLPISRKSAALLDEPTRVALLEAIDGAAAAYQARLPNASGAPSADSQQASASPNRATRRQRSSTTR